MDLSIALAIAQIIISVVLVFVILLQTKGSSFSGAFTGDTGSIYRSRRGIERTLFNFTIGLTVVFLVISLVSSIYR